jgi:hypothetical protein
MNKQDKQKATPQQLKQFPTCIFSCILIVVRRSLKPAGLKPFADCQNIALLQ